MHELVQTYFQWLDKKYPAPTEHLQRAGNALYGEVNYYSFCKVIDALKLTKDDVFLDIGSGLGLALFQVFFAASVHKAIGVELDITRHHQAQKRLKQLKKDMPAIFEGRELSLVQGDFLNKFYPEVTVAYTCSTAFDGDFLMALAHKLNEYPNLRTVVSYRKLTGLKGFKLSKIFSVECSWDTVNCYIYSK